MAASCRSTGSLVRTVRLHRRWDGRACTGRHDALFLQCVRTPPRAFEQARALSGGVESQSVAKFGPAVKLLLDLYDIRDGSVAASGPHGRLLKGDVLDYIAQKRLQRRPIELSARPVANVGPIAATSPEGRPGDGVSAIANGLPTSKQPLQATAAGVGSYADVELTSMRKTIAKRLTQAKMTIPHSYSTVDCTIDSLLTLRRRLADDGIKVSVNDFFVKSCALALQLVPEVNCTWDGERLVPANSVDISVAVATDSGLITPIVKNAANLTVEEISVKLRDLASRAKAGKLKLDEFQGGTFTVSNLGMFGISEFSAVINPPQLCILAIGSSRVVPDVDKGKPVTAVTVTLSADARAVDDALASRFLSVLKTVVEEPYRAAVGRLPGSVSSKSAAAVVR